jgi:GNAT superfamily N-acetyltransferase
MSIAVTVTHLEMLASSELRAKPAPTSDVRIARVPSPMPELNRYFYTAIGGDWYWWERLSWNYADWLKYLDRPEVNTWVISQAGIPAGYFELEQQAEGNVEIVYFGLLAHSLGQGLGGWALSEAVRQAWATGAKRVWLHTCNLDHPAALANYQARGFRIFKTEVKHEDLTATPGPWPGAGKQVK